MKHTTISFIYLIILNFSLTTAQILNQSLSNNLIGIDLLKQKKSQQTLENTNLDVDVTKYIVGNGDEFLISVIGLPSTSYILKIDANYDTYIPDMGVLKIGRVNLLEAQKVISTEVKNRLYSKYSVYVVPHKLKRVNLQISGAVKNPGTYTLDGNLRILDAVKSANNDTLPVLSESNLREVTVISGSDTLSLDLFQFLYKNDISQNPYIDPNTQIFIPFTTNKAFLSGAIKCPLGTTIPIKKNESAQSVLSLFPFENYADTNKILIKKASDNSSFSLSYAQSSSVIVEDNDMIVVLQKEEYPFMKYIKVTGEVKRPGDYPIIKSKTTVKEIIERCDGLTELADISRACIIRKSLDLSRLQNPTGSENIRPEVYSGLKKSVLLKDFSVIYLTNTSIPAETFVDEDLLYIPKKDNYVYMSGNVRNTGALPYSEGKELSYYIKLAGGLTKRADKSNISVVTTLSDGVSLIKETKTVLPGDIIVVPDRQQLKFWSTVLVPSISVVLALAGFLFNVYTQQD
ncbi:MAG: hypothetical protein GX640_16910 [Fibrobacter sp.]|nr:hypothetical protein [Fibrobacter sp.]